MTRLRCPGCARRDLILDCARHAAEAIAVDRLDVADRWADIAARLRGDDEFCDDEVAA